MIMTVADTLRPLFVFVSQAVLTMGNVSERASVPVCPGVTWNCTVCTVSVGSHPCHRTAWVVGL